MKAAVRRVSLSSLGRFGCVLGAVAALLPSLICAATALVAAGLVRGWLEGWQAVPIRFLGTEVARLDFVRELGLEGVLGALQRLTVAWAAKAALGALGLAVVGGALFAAVAVLVGVAYNWLANLTGGVEVELEDR